MNGSLVSAGLRTWVRSLAEPVARGLGRLGLTPNHLTFIGFGVAIVAAIAPVFHAWVAAGLLVLFGGVFDLFDGTLARSTGRVSRLGAFYDSVFDRAGEGVVYVGIVWACAPAGFFEGSALAAAAMAAAFMVSYTRAKSESLGFTTGTGMASVGLAPREIRVVILAVGLLACGLFGGLGLDECPAGLEDTLLDCFVVAGRDGEAPLGIALGLITILATITTIQRILYVRNQARED